MARKYSTRSVKVYNTFRTIFQYVACNWVIINILRSKYNVLKPAGLENIDRTKKSIIFVVSFKVLYFKGKFEKHYFNTN